MGLEAKVGLEILCKSSWQAARGSEKRRATHMFFAFKQVIAATGKIHGLFDEVIVEGE